METISNFAKCEDHQSNGFSVFSLVTFADIKDHVFKYKLLFPTAHLEKSVATNEITLLTEKLTKEVIKIR